jgi:FtsP/CotA-like multicopper oxidase with cupredoxin domain
MTNYRVDLGEMYGELIATDGQPCVPHGSSVFWVAVGQRMDVVVHVPSQPGAYVAPPPPFVNRDVIVNNALLSSHTYLMRVWSTHCQ